MTRNTLACWSAIFILTATAPTIRAAEPPKVTIVANGESKTAPQHCRGVIVGPGVNQPDPFPGYAGFVGWDSPLRLKNGDLILVFNAGYWHASVSTPMQYTPAHLEEYAKLGMPTKITAPTGGRSMITRSTDGGKTWSKPETIIDTPADDRHPAIIELDDASLLCCFFIYLGDEPELPAGTEPKPHVFFIRSTDGGKSWDKQPRPLGTPRFDETDGPIAKIKDGSLLLAVNGVIERGKPSQVGIFHSTDNGKTWPLVSTIKADHELSEASVTELHDGTWVMMARPEGDISWSSDRGKTWTPPVTFGMRMFAPSLYVLGDGTLVCLHGSYVNYGLRVIFSTDGGHTWIAPAKDFGFLVDTAYGYGKATPMPDGSLFISYQLTGGHQAGDAPAMTIPSIRLKVRDDHSGIELAPLH